MLFTEILPTGTNGVLLPFLKSEVIAASLAGKPNDGTLFKE